MIKSIAFEIEIKINKLLFSNLCLVKCKIWPLQTFHHSKYYHYSCMADCTLKFHTFNITLCFPTHFITILSPSASRGAKMQTLNHGILTNLSVICSYWINGLNKREFGKLTSIEKFKKFWSKENWATLNNTVVKSTCDQKSSKLSIGQNENFKKWWFILLKIMWLKDNVWYAQTSGQMSPV